MEKPKQIVFPLGFDPKNKPRFLLLAPVKVLANNEEMKRIEIYDGDWIEVSPDLNWKFVEEHGKYDDYHSYYLVGYSKQSQENPNYKSELASYKYQKAKYDEAIKFWEDWKSIWDKEQQKKPEEKERELLKQLKEKYEK